MVSDQIDFNKEYKLICSKLKRRFLKKPNLKNISEEFGSLAKQQEQYGHYHSAALCYVSKANCENLLANKFDEAKDLLIAAKLFLKSELETYQIRCISFSEDLELAIQQIYAALDIYASLGHTRICLSALLELADGLITMNRHLDAVPHLQKAIDMAKIDFPLEYILCLQKLNHVQINIGEYCDGLSTLSELYAALEYYSKSWLNVYLEEIISDCEISIVLLLLLTSTSNEMKMKYQNIIDKYNWKFGDDVQKAPYNDKEVFYILQELLQAYKNNNYNLFLEMQSSLWNLVEVHHQELLLVLGKRLIIFNEKLKDEIYVNLIHEQIN